MRVTKAMFEAENKSLDLQNRILINALQDCMDNRLVKLSTWKDKEGCTYKFHASSLDSPTGGLFWITFACDGQRDHTAVYYLEDMADWHNLYRPEDYARTEAVSKAKRLRTIATETGEERAKRVLGDATFDWAMPQDWAVEFNKATKFSPSGQIVWLYDDHGRMFGRPYPLTDEARKHLESYMPEPIKDVQHTER